MLKAKSKGMRTGVKPAAFVVPVKDCCVSEVLTSHSCEPMFWRLMLLSFVTGLCYLWEVM